MTPLVNQLVHDSQPPAGPGDFWDLGTGPSASTPFACIHHAFEERARCAPELVALEHLGSTMTYGELDARAAQLAAHLVESGVQPADHVGLFLQRSIPMVVGILAILKAGAAYVPQDLRITPAGHLSHIIGSAGIRVVLTVAGLQHRLPARDDLVVVPVDTFLDERAAVSADLEARSARTSINAEAEVASASTSGSTAVVIFTSGTTGKPNGVSVTHANLCNVVLNAPGSLGIEPGMRVSQLLNIAFDMAVWEIFGALSHGATLVIRGRDIEETVQRVDVVIATPSILGSVDAGRCHNVKVVAVAGERCPLPLAETWSAFCVFNNSCGPTEVTIVNTLQRYEHGSGELTIGRPLPNTTVYVLDDDLRPCAIGDVGEMWAGGACVTAGYVGNDVLTAERYRPDPFLSDGQRMFRTRDLARWTANGELEHHGRTDDQVKVNGFRIELDAVTSALELVTDCAQATTILHDGKLVAFVSPATVDVELAARAVEQTLPYYYKPSRVIAADVLPRTDRGKIDKRQLASWLDEPGRATPVVGPGMRLAGSPVRARVAKVAVA